MSAKQKKARKKEQEAAEAAAQEAQAEAGEAEAGEAEAGAEAEASPEDELRAWKDRALRAQAEMANIRRRLDSEVEQRTRRRLEALLHDLITVADHMELALAAIPEGVRGAEGADGFLLGMDAIRTALEGVMRQHGLDFIQPEAEADFDPAQHEAVQTEEQAELERPQLVLLRRGYRIGTQILRPAQVRVLKPANS